MTIFTFYLMLHVEIGVCDGLHAAVFDFLVIL